MKEWFTITELAEKTNIPDTTIRRYIQKFPDFFHFKGGSRSKRYEEISIKILVRIKNLFDGGFETDQVDATLRSEFPMVVDGDKQEEKETKTPALATAEDIAEIKEALKAQAEFNKRLVEKLDNQERYIKESIEKRDHLLVESIRQFQEEKKQLLIETAAAREEESQTPWYKKIFGLK